MPVAASSRCAARQWVVFGLRAAGLALVLQASALAQSDTLRVSALLQEGKLLLEETDTLEPDTRSLAEQGAALAAEEKALRAESQALDAGIKEFNAALQKYNEEAKAHRDACPAESRDKELVESCNAQVSVLRIRGEKLETERTQLIARQDSVNRRIAAFNAGYKDYANRKQQHDARATLNERDVREWLERVHDFFLSDDFKTVLASTAKPSVCDDRNIGSLSGLPSAQALRQAQACLQALPAGQR